MGIYLFGIMDKHREIKDILIRIVGALILLLLSLWGGKLEFLISWLTPTSPPQPPPILVGRIEETKIFRQLLETLQVGKDLSILLTRRGNAENAVARARQMREEFGSRYQIEVNTAQATLDNLQVRIRDQLNTYSIAVAGLARQPITERKMVLREVRGRTLPNREQRLVEFLEQHLDTVDRMGPAPITWLADFERVFRTFDD